MFGFTSSFFSTFDPHATDFYGRTHHPPCLANTFRFLDRSPRLSEANLATLSLPLHLVRALQFVKAAARQSRSKETYPSPRYRRTHLHTPLSSSVLMIV